MTFMDSAAALEESILDKLKSRQWRAGHRIPTERDFSQLHGLSRSTVRRVLAGLKARGLITQTVGSGTYVSERVAEALGVTGESAASATSPAELMGARMVLEPAIIDLVIGNANPADFARMEECCNKAEAATSLEDFEHWDGLLHEVIADAAHNAFIASVFRLMNRARSEGEWGLLKRRSATPERRLEYQQEHRALVAALKQRDAVQARALCLAHLVHVRHNMLGY